ncbi:MAG: thiamine pyrophosphate-dependent enzyme [Bacteroidetes bacterium]|nr:thiamine pyrophosphate-dependent enzyme [Bacteroidota bacterium]
MRLTEIPREELYQGSLGCSGCGSTLAVRLALKALGPRAIFVVPAACISTVSCYFPQTPFRVPMLVMAFAATGAAISGMSAALKRQGKSDVTVVGFAGDGGTVDIGLQSLSCALEGGRKFIYICYDNEAYMNTGVQRSGATPYGATTATTPGRHFEDKPKKDMMRIVAAHDIPYAATACVSYPQDYIEKVQRAATIDGPTYIHVLCPCPPGWGYPTERTIEIGRMAVECGLWSLKELRNGQFVPTYTPRRRRDPSEYYAAQARFRQFRAEQQP